MSHFFVNIVQITLLLSNYVICFYLPGKTEDPKTSGEIPIETQHAVCNVVTKEIEASAKATITRQLKGVCSSTDLESQLGQLQTIILKELQDIRQALGMPLQSNYKNAIYHTRSSTMELPSSTTTTTELPLYDYQDYLDTDDIRASKKHNLKSLTYSNVKQNHLVPDDDNLNDEIALYNDTIVESGDGDLYFYYWRIHEASKVLRKKDIYVSSPPFSVLGHTMYLHLYPNYMDQYIGILLKPESNSFLKKHKIMFLGQTSTQNVISSKKLYGIKNEEKIFKIEPPMLKNNFILDNSLLIKLKIYLNS